jgi:LuxR family transcriptional regulator, maltose regulon positive regulatory protein
VDAALVVRTPVIEALAGSGVRIVLVTAPGGYGKTSHVAAWARGDRRSVAWLTLEAVDNDPHALLTRVLDELAAVTDLDASGVPITGLMPRQYPTIAASRLARALAGISAAFVLVLDDIHVIESDASIDLLDAIVEAVPAGSELVLIGRGSRLNSVIRLRPNADVREVTLHDLAVGEQEAARILENLGVHASSDQVRRTVEEAEGWPVGVRLTGLLHRGPDEHWDSSPAPIAQERAIADYVWTQWLETSPAEDVEFLMRASVLPWLAGPLCDHVLERHDSAKVLRRIHEDRFVAIPLASDRDTFRLDPNTERHLHLRASGWFEAAGDDDLAVRHALAAGDLVRAERLVTAALPRLFTLGRSLTVQRWLDAFPRSYVHNRPPLCVAAGMSCLGVGDGDGALAWLQFGEHALERLGEAAGPLERAVFAAFRSMVRPDAVDASLRDAMAGYRGLPPGAWRAGACIALGSLSWMKGDLDTAASMLAQAAAEARVAAAPSVEAMSRGRLALVCSTRGDLEGAHRHAAWARHLQHHAGLDEMPTLHIVPAMVGLLAALDGHPETARQELQRSRRNLAYFDGNGVWVSVPTRLVLAETAVLLGDHSNAKLLVNEARALLAATPDATLAHQRVEALDEQLHRSHRSGPTGRFALTTAELRVLHFLPTNLHQSEIASRLYLSRFTVKSHVSAIYRKLGAKSRTEAVALARAAGLLPDDGSGGA